MNVAQASSRSPIKVKLVSIRLVLASLLIPIPFLCAPVGPSATATTHALTDDSETDAQISEYVREITQDLDGNFWFGTNGDGVCRYDGTSLTYFSAEQGFGGRAVRGMLQDPDGAMWFATDGGVSRLESGNFTNYTTANGLSDNQVWSIFRDSGGTIWVGTMAGVCRFNGTSFVPFPIPRVEVENPAEGFGPQVIWTMFEDRSGHIWFGTDGEGAHRYDGNTFTSFTTKQGLAGNTVRCITGDRNGHLWLGTRLGGVSRFDGKSIRNFTSKDGLTNNKVYEAREDSAGNLWFSTLGAGVCKYDGTTFTSFGANDGLSLLHVQEIFEDTDGVLWFGCSGGLFRLDGNTFVNVKRGGPWLPLTRGKPRAGGAPIVDPFSGWPTETFELPPGFAPNLPTGSESLLFAPGWRNPDSEEFWSYAFVMSIDESAPDAARVDDLLEQYYNGLMSTFASSKGKEKEVSAVPVRVDVVRTAPNRFEAKMHLIDAFATFEPIDLRVVINTAAVTDKRSSVRVQVSSQPGGHEVWSRLDGAISRILSPIETKKPKVDEAARSLGALTERTVYAGLDESAVKALAREAQARWPQEFAGFTLKSVERCEAGGLTHWMSTWTHAKTGLEFVLVPGGTFPMGSPVSEPNRREDELQHSVTIDPFLIARTECTQGAWAQLASTAGVDRAPSHFKGSKLLPVESISLQDIAAWCAVAELSLPTEAQWEFACRGGTTSAWAMGANKNGLSRFGNLGSADCPQSWIDHEFDITEPWLDGFGDEMAPAGSFNCNSFGLFDVHGNVREWCRDAYSSYQVRPKNGTGLRPGVSEHYVARGGSFNAPARTARSARRLKDSGAVHRHHGFRPSMDLPF